MTAESRLWPVTTDMSFLYLLPLIPILFYLLKPHSIPSIPNATPNLPFIGNSIFFGIDPVKFLLAQRARFGDVFLVNLCIIRIVFFLGPAGTNAILKGTERSGISFWEAVRFIFGGGMDPGTTP